MAIDPTLWGNLPGLGRAPLLPDPTQPSPTATDPMRDLALRLATATGNDRVLARDRPVGALVRDPAGMTQQQQISEMMALGGFPHEGPAIGTRVPAGIAGGLASLGGAPGVGLAMGQMAKAGVQQRQRDLAGALTQGMMEAHERGSQARDQRSIDAPTRSMVDAYEAGRQAAVGYRNERDSARDQARDRESLSGGRGGGISAGGAGRDTFSGGRF